MTRSERNKNIHSPKMREFLIQHVRDNGNIDRACRSAGLSRSIVEQYRPLLIEELMKEVARHATKVGKL